MKIKGKVAFSTATVLTLALICAGIVKNPSTKSKADSAAEYFDVDFFDYEQSNATYDKQDSNKLLFGRQNGGQASSEHNTWKTETEYKVVQGLAADTLTNDTFALNGKTVVSGNDIKNSLFEKDYGYKGTHKFPFVKNADGYYEYDSNNTHVEITEQGKEMKSLSGKTQYGFMPLNEVNENSKNSDGYIMNNPNFYFGMSMGIEFTMPKNGKIGDKPMKFEFAGDDDMWVYVDGKLVLDLGGVHTTVEGSIDFANGKVTTVGNHINCNKKTYNTNKDTVTVDNDFINGLSTGDHTLRIYYLERGASVSRCKIMFRLKDPKPAEEPKVEPEKVEPAVVPTVEPTKEPEEPKVEPEKVEPAVEPEKPVETTTEPTAQTVVTPEPIAMPATDEVVEPQETYTEPATEDSEPVIEDIQEEDEPAVVKAVKEILPQTGTLEEYIFYIIGGLLVLGGISLVVIQSMKTKKTK